MTVAEAPPSDYRLLVPDGWFRIALDPKLWERRIKAFVAERFRGVDNQPVLKQQVTEQLIGQAAAAYGNGGMELYLSMMAAAGIPIAAGLVVSYAPPPPGSAHPPLEDVVESLGEKRAALVSLPAGDAVRHQYKELPSPEDPGWLGNPEILVTHLDYQIPVPGTEGRLLLSFSTPVEPLAAALTELFDAIARTLRWVE